MPKTEWSPAGARRAVKLAMTGVRRVERQVRRHIPPGVTGPGLHLLYRLDELVVEGEGCAKLGLPLGDLALPQRGPAYGPTEVASVAELNAEQIGVGWRANVG